MEVGVYFVGMGAAATVGVLLMVVSRSLIYCFGKPAIGFRIKPIAHGLLVQTAAMLALLFVFSPAYDLRYDLGPSVVMVLLANAAGWLGMRDAARRP